MTKKTKFKRPDNLSNLAKKYLPPSGVYFVSVQSCHTRFTRKGKVYPEAIVTFSIQRGDYCGLEFEWKYNFCDEDAAWEDFASLCRALRVNFLGLKLKNPMRLNGCLPDRNIFIEIEEPNVGERRVGKYYKSCLSFIALKSAAETRLMENITETKNSLRKES